MSNNHEKFKPSRLFRALVAGVTLVGATPSPSLGQESYRDGARIEYFVGGGETTRTVNIVGENGESRRQTILYVEDEEVFFDSGQTARMVTNDENIVPREEGIQNEDLYLATLGLNPVVPRNENLTPAQRREMALQNPEANADALIADGFPTELRTRLVADFQRSQRLTQAQIEQNQVYLIPGFIADGMTQSDGRGGVRNVGLTNQQVRMRLEQARQGGARFVSYPAEIIGTYIWTDVRNVSYEVTVFVIDECGNAAFRMRQIEQVEQPSVQTNIPIAPQEALPDPCIEVVVEGGPRRGESVAVIMMAEIRRADRGELSAEEIENIRACLGRTVLEGTVDPTDLCPDEVCDYDRELRTILTPVIREAGIQGEVTITAINPMRSLMPNNTARFFIPRPAEDGSVIYLPAFCIFNVQGERSRQVVHRSNLLVEQSADTIEDADGHLAINLRNNPVVRWFEINERRRTVREVQSIPGGQ